MAKASVASKPKLPPPMQPLPTQAQVEQFVQTMGNTAENVQVTEVPVTQSTSDPVHSLPDHSVSQVTQSSKARGTVARKRGPSVARIVAYLDTSLGDQLLVRAATERRPISDCVAEAVQQWLKPSSTT